MATLLPHLKSVQKLRMLDLSSVTNTIEVLVLTGALAKRSNTITDLTLARSPLINDSGIRRMVACLPQLQSLRLVDLECVTSGLIEDLVGVSGAGGELPVLHSIACEGCPGVMFRPGGLEGLLQSLGREGKVTVQQLRM